MNKGTTGILLVALGLIMLYVILSDKYSCFVGFFDCLFDTSNAAKVFTQSSTPAAAQNPPGASGQSIGTPPFAGGAKTDMFGLLKGILGMKP
jgi:hypothetical protein